MSSWPGTIPRTVPSDGSYQLDGKPTGMLSCDLLLRLCDDDCREYSNTNSRITESIEAAATILSQMSTK